MALLTQCTICDSRKLRFSAVPRFRAVYDISAFFIVLLLYMRLLLPQSQQDSAFAAGDGVLLLR